MKAVLDFINTQKKKYTHLPLFEFMRDKSVAPSQRLAFAPCFAHFVMSFSDLNKYVFRDESSNDEIQKIINRHTEEDAHHWPLFLEDIDKLNFNQSLNLEESLRFLWGKDTKIARQLSYQIAGHALTAEPIEKLIIIEAIEATGSVFLSATREVALELQEITGKEYRYFGDFHLAKETGHASGSDNAEGFIESIELSEAQREKAFVLVEQIFTIFTASTNELLAYANKSCKQNDLKVHATRVIPLSSSVENVAS